MATALAENTTTDTEAAPIPTPRLLPWQRPRCSDDEEICGVTGVSACPTSEALIKTCPSC